MSERPLVLLERMKPEAGSERWDDWSSLRDHLRALDLADESMAAEERARAEWGRLLSHVTTATVESKAAVSANSERLQHLAATVSGLDASVGKLADEVTKTREAPPEDASWAAVVMYTAKKEPVKYSTLLGVVVLILMRLLSSFGVDVPTIPVSEVFQDAIHDVPAASVGADTGALDPEGDGLSLRPGDGGTGSPGGGRP